MRPEPPLTSEVIAGGGDLWARIRPIWRDLLERTSETSAFLSEVWIDRWLAHFGGEAEIGAVIWRDGSTVVACAILPEGRGWAGPFSIRRTFLNASGVLGVGCEHNDVVVLDEYRSRVLDDLVERVRSGGCDEWCLVGVRRSLLDELMARWPEGWWEGYESESPFVDLDTIRALDGGYLSSLSSNTRSQIRRSLRLYEERFGPPVTEVAESPGEALSWFEEMVGLHQATWEARGEAGAFAERRVVAFYQDLIETTTVERSGFRTEMLRVRFGDQTIGILLNFIYQGHVAFYQSGLSYHDDSKLKPGLVTHAQAIALSVDRGDLVYDFLGGEEEGVRYKRSLSSDRRALIWGQLQVNTTKSEVVRRLRRARDYVRGIGRD